MAEEEVLVIPEERLKLLGAFSGYRPFNQQAFEALLNPDFMSFRPRSTVEEDPTFKQLIPYVVLQFNSPAGPSVFQYTRGKGQGEKRLHALRSVGIGGHISREDAAGNNDLYRAGMERELHEEVMLNAEFQEELVGFIYDDSSPVGRVHLGVVHRLILDSDDVSNRETEIADSGFQPVAEMLTKLDEFETWSQLCLTNLF